MIAELLYYLDPRRVMPALAVQVAERLRRGGTLVLAHHRITFYDFVQQAEGIHRRFLDESGIDWHVRTVRRTGRWQVLACKIAGKRANPAGKRRSGTMSRG